MSSPLASLRETPRHVIVTTSFGWDIVLTRKQFNVATELLSNGADHYTIFRALTREGVPTRLNGGYPASQAITALRDLHHTRSLIAQQQSTLARATARANL